MTLSKNLSIFLFISIAVLIFFLGFFGGRIYEQGVIKHQIQKDHIEKMESCSHHKMMMKHKYYFER